VGQVAPGDEDGGGGEDYISALQGHFTKHGIFRALCGAAGHAGAMSWRGGRWTADGGRCTGTRRTIALSSEREPCTKPLPVVTHVTRPALLLRIHCTARTPPGFYASIRSEHVRRRRPQD
jgi:hypothetical protein